MDLPDIAAYVYGLDPRFVETYMKRVKRRIAGFLRLLWFPPTWNVDRVGWDQLLTDPSNVAVLRRCLMVIRDTLRKPSTRSG